MYIYIYYIYNVLFTIDYSISVIYFDHYRDYDCQYHRQLSLAVYMWGGPKMGVPH